MAGPEQHRARLPRVTDICYLLGAGLNQVIRNSDGVSPPLSKTFFQVASRMRKFADSHYQGKVKAVYEYIQRFWKLDRDDLARIPFDLEECFTLMELQFREALFSGDTAKMNELSALLFKLKSYLAELLSEFNAFASTSEEMLRFGEKLYVQRPTIITFNYDCFVESAIEGGSGVNIDIPREFSQAFTRSEDEVSEAELPYSHFNWNRPLGYGIKFDQVQLYRAGIGRFVPGDRFYAHPANRLYSWRVLKLHGSLNWFRYLPIRKYPALGERKQDLSEGQQQEVILVEGDWWFNEPPDLGGWYIDPLIITPTLYKEEYFRDPQFGRVFTPLWKMAREALSQCRRLVVIGYSFPPTDFPTRKLFLESFSERSPEEVIVVSPDTSIVQTVKDLCHFRKPVMVCRDLAEFLHLR